MKKRSGKTGSAQAGTRRQGSRAPAVAAPARAVFLVGFMGAGKSSVGRALGERLNWVFEDLDDRIEQREGRTVAEIFRDSGEPEFRRAEHAALQEVLQELRRGGMRIIALGGGAFVQDENAALISESSYPSVFLEASADELWDRCCRQASATGAERPLLRKRDEFSKLYETRKLAYEKASIRIQTGQRSVESIADEIAAALGLRKIVIRSEQGEVE